MNLLKMCASTYSAGALIVLLSIFSGHLYAENITGVYNVRDFGATANGKTVDSDAINLAIHAAYKAGGGTIVFPAGDYLSYSLRLKSNISIYLSQGATIIAAEPTDSSGYDPPEEGPGNRYQDYGHSHWHNSLIWGEDLENISITGPGMIHGKGLKRSRPYRFPHANKAIALKNCRNVILRDFTVLMGGHFGILATGVDNMTIDNLKMDTNRDGIDVDCCRNVHISNCSINSPWDDAICLKSSYALGYARATENVTITNCQVSGYDRGTFLDGTYQKKEAHLAPDHEGPTGRIKFGTESNGGFKNITISNCVFDYCRGLALETVDGGLLEDVTISNITMRNTINSPIFLRLGARMRGPDNTPVGKLRRINISNVVVYNADSRFSCLITGIPDHHIEDITLSNINIWYKPLDAESGTIPENVPEMADGYPEPQKFGLIPSYGFFIRHVKNVKMHNINIYHTGNEKRPAILLDDVHGLYLTNSEFQQPENGESMHIMHSANIKIKGCENMRDTELEQIENKIIK
ncbi:glycoside hydrolase family 28 protein [Saccharicrinis sp. FJH2]|uniref:rhamnogalacturonidase n=1 Tax=Saccharicrinis sp. FJH65 TaxID=3344659 RepID=UPI0035F339E5